MIQQLFKLPQQVKALVKSSMVLIGLVASSSAFAHPGHEHHHAGMLDSLWAGFTHPLTGFDHLVMLLAVGFIAMRYKKQGQQRRYVSLAIVCMAVGLGLGAATGFVTGIEMLIVASIFMAAIALYMKQSQFSGWVSALAVGLVLFHGWAHGLEASGASLIAFAAGMVIAATVLASFGYRLAAYISPKWQSAMLLISGTALLVAS
ncbi:urease accessory protein UreJ [Photobacterium sanctipauli]|uniref:Urease accessory protein UreJ n=1 Tax=Photobacterium sanctipauli TaxID=1342794 RepID=A0A2T3NZR9_9GAMM|nr:HupE/UreJ family protein [Photobacterium sanctipauli]PSW21776.1 urease accessory protein UreJ [Photobacterium sanctipauli]